MNSKDSCSNFQIDYIREIMQSDPIAGQELIRSNKSLITAMAISNETKKKPKNKKKK